MGATPTYNLTPFREVLNQLKIDMRGLNLTLDEQPEDPETSFPPEKTEETPSSEKTAKNRNSWFTRPAAKKDISWFTRPAAKKDISWFTGRRENTPYIDEGAEDHSDAESALNFKLTMGFYSEWLGRNRVYRSWNITSMSMSSQLDAFVIKNNKNAECLTLRDLLDFVEKKTRKDTAGILVLPQKIYHVTYAKVVKGGKTVVLLLQRAMPIEEPAKTDAELLRECPLGRMLDQEFWI